MKLYVWTLTLRSYLQKGVIYLPAAEQATRMVQALKRSGLYAVAFWACTFMKLRKKKKKDFFAFIFTRILNTSK